FNSPPPAGSAASSAATGNLSFTTEDTNLHLSAFSPTIEGHLTATIQLCPRGFSVMRICKSVNAFLEDPWLTKSSQNDQNSGGDQTSVNVHLESLLELAPSYGE